MEKQFYLLLKELGYLSDEDFQLTEQDQAEGITSVDEKLQLAHHLNVEHNGTYATYKDLQGRGVVIMKGEEGIDNLVKDRLEEMDKDELIKLIGWLPGKGTSVGYRGVLEEWNWKLEERGEFFINEFTYATSSSVFTKLMLLANRLDEKGLKQEASVIDDLLMKEIM